MLWICGRDQNQRMKRESFYLYKLRIENRVIQKANADSVNGVYCLKGQVQGMG